MAQEAKGPIGTGVAGLGRSGWGIHCSLLDPLKEKFSIVAVFDKDPHRRAEAEARFRCKISDDYDAMLADEKVELVIVAIPSYLHADFSIRALKAGKHVVCEKPMASNLDEADRMVRAARRSGKILTIFHNRRYDPMFQKVREIIRSGRLGRIVEIKIASHGFGRRWDWQTLKKYGGGLLRNNGSHILDCVLDLLGDVDVKVACYMDRALALGDAEDHVKVVLQPSQGPVVDVEVTSACAYPQEDWLVMGTQGGLSGDAGVLRWKYFDPAELPPRRLDEKPTPDRSYNREKIPWKPEETWSRESHEWPGWGIYYLDLYETIRSGAPLVIRPEAVRRQMAIIEECLRQSQIYAPGKPGTRNRKSKPGKR